MRAVRYDFNGIAGTSPVTYAKYHTCNQAKINGFRPVCDDLKIEVHPLLTGPLIIVILRPYRGGVAERLNALVLKTSEGESPPRVRISPPPPFHPLR